MSLNPVITSVKIDGKDRHFVNLELHQKFNDHHTFAVKIDFEQFEKKWLESPAKMIQLIGKDVDITMQHKETGESYNFKGIVTDISMAGQHGEQNYYVIYGSSPTIKLEGKPTMDSFVDSTLKNIVDEAVGTSGNGGEITASPKFGGTIEYICQYNESAFQFLNRLSWKYGEWNFYNGITHYFGKPDVGAPYEVYYDKEMTHFDLRARMVQPAYTRYHYISKDDDPISNALPAEVGGVRGYIKASLDASNQIYGKSKAILPSETSISNLKELEDLVKVEKYRAVANSLIMQGQTETCKVQIGKLVKIILPSTMEVSVKEVETFLVTEVSHFADQNGTYYNSFSGIPSEMENVPMQPVHAPTAYPQIAWVKSNADPKNQGRVQVEFQWQKTANKTTNWIKVQTPDAGGGGDKVASNRGLVTIPEEGDMVMVNFEYGDPDRPFTSGSIYTSKAGGGGGQGNKTKSLTTRSGNTVSLNDEDGSVLIADQTGEDLIMIDGKDKLSIFTTKTIELSNGQASIVLEEDTILINAAEVLVNGSSTAVMSSGEGQAICVTSEGDTNVILNGPAVVLGGESMVINGKKTLDMASKAATLDGSATLDISGGLVKINS